MSALPVVQHALDNSGVPLRTPPYHYGTTAAGLFGLLGASSAAAAPFVGRISDRHGPERRSWLRSSRRSPAISSFCLRPHPARPDCRHRAHRYRRAVRPRCESIAHLQPCAGGEKPDQYLLYGGLLCGGAMGSYLGPLGFNRAGWVGFCAIPLAALTFALIYFIRADHQL